MMRVIKGWLLPNVGFKFRVDRPDGCGDIMGSAFGGLRAPVVPLTCPADSYVIGFLIKKLFLNLRM